MKTKSNIKFLPKQYTYYLSNANTNMFLNPNWQKWSIICNIFTRFSQIIWSKQHTCENLKLLKNDISQQLSNIFNISFSTVQFPSVLKIAKVIPIYKKQSKVNYTNYKPISLLSNVEMIIETLMYKRLSNYLDINNLIYS